MRHASQGLVLLPKDWSHSKELFLFQEVGPTPPDPFYRRLIMFSPGIGRTGIGRIPQGLVLVPRGLVFPGNWS